MKKKLGRLLVGFMTLALVSGCAGRVPSPQTSQKIVTKYFKKYGKKYPKSDFGHSLTRVEIVKVEEVQKNIASIEAYTYLDQGRTHWIRLTVLRKPLRWKPIAWENIAEQ